MLPRQEQHEIGHDFAYARPHGPGDPYQGYYSHDALRAWAERLRGWRSQLAAGIYVYFDNDQAGYAARNALELRALMGVEQG